MTSGSDLERNLNVAERLIAQAAGEGAELVVLPENVAFLGRHDSERIAIAEAPGDGPVQRRFAAAAAQHGVWLVAGTLPLSDPEDEQRATASCLVYDADGQQRARYDKIHLFDVEVADDGGGASERYRESARTRAGTAPVTLETPWGVLGLAVCYDLRFPELFRALADAEPVLLAVPAAFTAPTGRAHWELLVRTRAVESLCPLIAAAQAGRHDSGRETWGHSMVVDAWGEVRAELERAPGVALADLDLARTAELRRAFPVLSHRVL